MSSSGGSISSYIGSKWATIAVAAAIAAGGAGAIVVTGGSGGGSDCLAADECYPKPLNAGVGATGVPDGHTPAGGCTTSPSSGAVVQNCLFTDGVTITTTGAGATYRYSDFRAPVTHAGTGTLTYEYSNFGLTSGCSTYDAIVRGGSYTVRYSRFTAHIDEGPRISDDNILIEENFIGPICSNPGDHADGIQGYFGGTNAVIRHNTIDVRTASPDVTAAIFMADSSETAIVEDNLLIGGGYTVRLHDDFTPDHGPWVLTDNRIVDGAWISGPMNNSGTTFTGTTCARNRLVTIDANYEITSLGSTVSC